MEGSAALSEFPRWWLHSVHGSVCLAAVEYGVPHRVVPQLLRGLIECRIPGGSVNVRTARDFDCCGFDSIKAFVPPVACSAAKEAKKCEGAKASNETNDAAPGSETGSTPATCSPSTEPTPLELFGRFSQVRSLTRLDVSDCFNLDADVLQEISATPSLVMLSVAGCEGVTPETVWCLTRLRALTSLDLSSCFNIDDASITDRICPEMPQLRVLNLSHCVGLGGAAFSAAAALPELTSLDVSYCVGLSDDALEVMVASPRLATVDLRGCSGVSDKAVKDLATKRADKTVVYRYRRLFSADVRARAL